MKDLRPTIGLSHCLLGEQVRHNGGHLKQDWITDELAQFVEFAPVCPEVEMGLGVPREAMRLVYEKDDISLETSPTKKDKSAPINNYTELAKETNVRLSKSIVEKIEEGLCGFIFAKKSPTCGLERVKIYNRDNGIPDKYGQGLFAEQLTQAIPELPVIDSGRIINTQLREDFVRQSMAFFQFHKLEKRISALQSFHRRYKYILMEYDHGQVAELGRLAAQGHESHEINNLFALYRRKFFEVLKAKSPSKKSRKNVFYHLLGYFKKELSACDKKYFLDLVDDYDRGHVPYITVVKFLDYFVHKYNQTYLADQYYFEPYPKQLSIHKDAK